MSIKISITHNFPDVQRKLAALHEDVRAKATASAINRTMAQAKTAMSREIRQEFNISAAKVNESLVLRRASFRDGVAYLSASLESPTKRGRSLNLINFAARQTKQGVSFKILRAGGRKTIKGAFIANQGRTVFIRVGRKRLPIKALQTIDVAQMFNTKRVNARVVEFMQSKFEEVFDREARFYTDRFNQTGSTR